MPIRMLAVLVNSQKARGHLTDSTNLIMWWVLTEYLRPSTAITIDFSSACCATNDIVLNFGDKW